MLKLLLLLGLSNLTQLVDAAADCKVGWPIIFADVDKDGDTEVQAWASTDLDKTSEFLIGGRSTSLSFTEQDDVCDKVGCAWLVLWRQVGSVISHRTIFKEVNSVLDIQIDYTADPKLAAVLFLKVESSTRGKYVLQFFKNEDSISDPWPAITRAYIFNERIDLGQLDQFSTVMLFQNNFVQMIGNLPSKYEIVDFFAKLDSSTNLMSSVMTTVTSTEGTYFNGMPTRKNGLMFGFDSDNVI